MIPGIVAAQSVAVVPTWTPASLSPGPRMWLNDDSGLNINAGTATQWDDISGTGYHMGSINTLTTNPSIVAAGLNGRRVLRFDGTAQFLKSTAAQPVFQNTGAGWALIVYKRAGADSAQRTLLSSVNGVDDSSRFIVNAQVSVAHQPVLYARREDSDGTSVLSAASTTSATWQMLLMAVDWANGDGTIYLNGTQDAQNAQNTSFTSSGLTSNTPALRSIGLGAYVSSGSETGSAFSDVDIAEVIVGNGTIPSGADIDRLFGYVAHRWGLTTNLPALHPYKTTPP